MEKIYWKVTGMTCANCALTINKFLQQSGANNVSVNALGGDVYFEINNDQAKSDLIKGVESLGYLVKEQQLKKATDKKLFLSTHLQRFLFCLPFTIVLMMDMIPGIHIPFLMNGYIKLLLTAPVFLVGMNFFGRSAWKSIRNRLPNMNVLISLGAFISFIFSIVSTFFRLGVNYQFYETTSSIITLIFLGNYLEEISVQSTQRSLNKLIRSQKVMANMIAFDENHHELIFPLDSEQLKEGDLILINSGEQVPADCKILWGEGYLNESLLTGEINPVYKKKKDILIGGSIVEQGNVKAQVTAAANNSILSTILMMVRKAQGEKPPVQQLADRISAIFVPVVISIAFLTLIINWFLLKSFPPSLIRSITVLVIACPCAMGLATPAAIAVGMGRSARNGVLFRNARHLELFKNICQVIFDKTGTLTKGIFSVTNFKFFNTEEKEFKRIVYSLEKFSTHPLAKSLVEKWKMIDEIKWSTVKEIKGSGIEAADKQGNFYFLGSYNSVKKHFNEPGHNIYVLKNAQCIGWIDLEDEIRSESQFVINYLHSKNIKTILLSGDNWMNTKKIADILQIDEVYAEQSPEEKLKKIGELSQNAPSIMIGDGINDAPALAKATIGISMSEASQLALQTADVVLMNSGISKLPLAIWIGKATYKTIKQNLFWAFGYNLVAIPIAAIGLLGKFAPTYGAFLMALSDVFLIANSLIFLLKSIPTFKPQ